MTIPNTASCRKTCNGRLSDTRLLLTQKYPLRYLYGYFAASEIFGFTDCPPATTMGSVFSPAASCHATKV
jgi:hypothetical protein